MFSYNSNNAKDEDLRQQKVLNTNAEKLLPNQNADITNTIYRIS